MEIQGIALSRRKRRKWALIIGAVGMLLIVALTGGCGARKTGGQPAGGQEQPKAETVAGKSGGEVKCEGCHEMAPEFFTWQASSHSRISCQECHQANIGDYQAKHDQNTFDKPIRMIQPISNGACLKCHPANQNFSPANGLLFSHSKHDRMGVLCVVCHNGVVHGQVARRPGVLTGELADYTNWNLDAGRKVLTQTYTRPGMQTCLDCHKATKAPDKCAACHAKIPSPSSHEAPAWPVDHGKTARADPGACVQCHQPEASRPSTGDSAADLARAGGFCYSCHAKPPASHDSQMGTHPQKAAAKGLANCFTCHNRGQPEPGERAAATYCNRCHQFPAGEQKK